MTLEGWEKLVRSRHAPPTPDPTPTILLLCSGVEPSNRTFITYENVLYLCCPVWYHQPHMLVNTKYVASSNEEMQFNVI